MNAPSTRRLPATGAAIRFTDEQRMRLAEKAKVLGRRALDGLEILVTPDY